MRFDSRVDAPADKGATVTVKSCDVDKQTERMWSKMEQIRNRNDCLKSYRKPKTKRNRNAMYLIYNKLIVRLRHIRSFNGIHSIRLPKVRLVSFSLLATVAATSKQTRWKIDLFIGASEAVFLFSSNWHTWEPTYIFPLLELVCTLVKHKFN